MRLVSFPLHARPRAVNRGECVLLFSRTTRRPSPVSLCSRTLAFPLRSEEALIVDSDLLFQPRGS